MDARLIPLTVPEIRHLLWRLADPSAPRAAGALGWSVWRRQHQATARRHHYRRRLALHPP